MWRGEKSLLYQDSNSDPSAVQPVAIRYTDCTILALSFLVLTNKNGEVIVTQTNDFINKFTTCFDPDRPSPGDSWGVQK
jgi:hypothetical protein